MAYITSDKYKELVYDEDAEQTLDIIINGQKIEEDYVKNVSFKDDIFENNSFSLGSTIASRFEIEFDNEALTDIGDFSEITMQSNMIIGEDKETIPLGNYIIQTKDTTSSDYTKITMLDYMVKFDVEFDASEVVPCTRYELLQAICNHCGVELYNESIINGDVIVNSYDSNLTAKSYISLIAERAGGYAKIIRNKLKIVSFGNSDVIELPEEMAGDYTINDQMTITKVIYENGIQKFEKGTDDGETIFLSQESLFSCTQEEVDNIYENINGLKFQSLDIKIWGDASIDTGDVLKLGDIYSFAQKDWTWGNGFYGSYKTVLDKVEQSSNVDKTPTKEKIRKLNSSLNELDGKIELLVQETDEYDSRITKVEQTAESINQLVSSMTDLVREVTSLGKIELTDCQTGPLLNLTITGNIEAQYLENDLYLEDNLYLKYTNLVVEDKNGNQTIYKLDFPDCDKLIYEATLNEETKLYIGILKAYLNDVEVSAQEILINLTEGTNTIWLQSYHDFPLSYAITYTIQGEYSKKFALKTELNSSIEQVNNKINLALEEILDGESVTAAKILMAINDDISSIKVQADKLALEGITTINGKFKVLEDGSIEAVDGKFSGNIYFPNSNSKVIGGEGLLTNLDFESDTGVLGYTMYASEGLVIEKGKLHLDIYIPNNFTMTEAKIHVDLFQTKNVYTADSSGTYGKVDNIRLYKESLSAGYTNSWLGLFESQGSPSEIENAFSDNGGYSATTTSRSYFESVDIKDNLSSGTNKLIIQTGNNDLSAELDADITTATEQTQIAFAKINILGYMSFSE